MSDSSSVSRASKWRAVDGILLLDKPLGISSNQALQVVRRAYAAAKGGHTGNLDVAASGLLPLCFGEATKICGFLLDSDKRYQAVVKFGQTSSTGDSEGEITATGGPLPTDRAIIEQALDLLRGPIQQVPPMYSALKHAGQPLYKLARQGIEIARKARAVQIYQLDLVDHAEETVALDIRCSKGTYIRSLAISLGEILGCGAYLAALRRLEAGPFVITQAHSLEIFRAAQYTVQEYAELLMPMDVALAHLPRITLTSAAALRFCHGQSVDCSDSTDMACEVPLRIYHEAGPFLGMGSLDAGGRLRPKRLVKQQAASEG
jgi:tRNA pseudouridine55 synthase